MRGEVAVSVGNRILFTKSEKAGGPDIWPAHVRRPGQREGSFFRHPQI
jgi:hypothetical protein